MWRAPLDLKNSHLSLRGPGSLHLSPTVGCVRSKGAKVREREGRGSGREGRRSGRALSANRRDAQDLNGLH